MLVVLSSVAGDRARRSNFVYGSTKAGLDAFAQGLGDALHGSGARVLIVRPGFVRTRMTTGLDEAPMTIDPEDVGRIMELIGRVANRLTEAARGEGEAGAIARIALCELHAACASPD